MSAYRVVMRKVGFAVLTPRLKHLNPGQEIVTCARIKS
jgi:hypothetical protein